MKQLDLTGLEWKINSELQKLMEYVCGKLDAAGLIDVTSDYVHDANHTYAGEGRLQNTPYSSDPNSGYTGETLQVEVVNRYNGTVANVSLRLDHIIWKHNSGHLANRIKISYRDSQKKIDRLIQEAIDDYNRA